MTPLVAAALYTVTAFCCVGRGGGYCGRTWSGTQIGPGQIAAPPSMPIGMRVVIPGYGVGTVTDRGGAIRDGYVDRRGTWHPPVLDVWFRDCRLAWAWGRREVWVRPLVDPPAEPITVEISPEAPQVIGPESEDQP